MSQPDKRSENALVASLGGLVAVFGALSAVLYATGVLSDFAAGLMTGLALVMLVAMGILIAKEDKTV